MKENNIPTIQAQESMEFLGKSILSLAWMVGMLYTLLHIEYNYSWALPLVYRHSYLNTT